MIIIKSIFINIYIKVKKYICLCLKIYVQVNFSILINYNFYKNNNILMKILKYIILNLMQNLFIEYFNKKMNFILQNNKKNNFLML